MQVFLFRKQLHFWIHARVAKAGAQLEGGRGRPPLLFFENTLILEKRTLIVSILILNLLFIM